MKRIRPQRQYEQDPTYPSLEAAPSNPSPGTSRRGFLRAALAVGAAVGGGALLGGCPGAMPRPRLPGGMPAPVFPYQRTVQLSQPIKLVPPEPRARPLLIRSVSVATQDSKLGLFIRDPSQLDGIRSSITSAIQSFTCVDSARGLRAKIRLRIQKTLATHYRRCTGRSFPHSAIRIKLLA